MNADVEKAVQKVLFIVVFASSLFLVLTYLLSMGLGMLVFFSTVEGLRFSRASLSLHPLLIRDIEVTVNAGLYFVFLWSVFALCFIAAWNYRRSLNNRIREFVSDATTRSLFRNNLLAMPAITSMLLVAIIVLDHLQMQAGIQTGELGLSDPFFDFMLVSQAPLTEEMVFRIMPIGSFLAIYVFLVGKSTKSEFSYVRRLKTCFLALLQPETAKKAVGLKTIGEGGLFGGVIWAEWVMVLLTATFFGIAHYLGGWGPGKISEAAVSGTVFALAYLYYGIQAPILLHWFFNYYFFVFDLSLSYLAETNFLSFSWSASILFGTLLWVVVIIFGAVYISKVLMKKFKAAPVSEPPLGG